MADSSYRTYGSGLVSAGYPSDKNGQQVATSARTLGTDGYGRLVFSGLDDTAYSRANDYGHEIERDTGEGTAQFPGETVAAYQQRISGYRGTVQQFENTRGLDIIPGQSGSPVFTLDDTWKYGSRYALVGIVSNGNVGPNGELYLPAVDAPANFACPITPSVINDLNLWLGFGSGGGAGGVRGIVDPPPASPVPDRPILAGYDALLGTTGDWLTGGFRYGSAKFVVQRFTLYNRGLATATSTRVRFNLFDADTLALVDVPLYSTWDTQWGRIPIAPGESHQYQVELRPLTDPIGQLPPGRYRVGWTVEEDGDAGYDSGLFPQTILLRPEPTVTGLPEEARLRYGRDSDPIPFTVSDWMDPPDQITVSADIWGIDGSVGPVIDGIQVTGTGANRAIVLSPVWTGDRSAGEGSGPTGSTGIRVRAANTGSLLGESGFNAVVLPNEGPLISAPAAVTAGSGRPVAVTVTLDDDRLYGQGMILSATADDPTLLPASGIALTGTGANRTVQLAPAAGRTGRTTVTLTATDADGLSRSQTFTFDVQPNQPPTLTAVPDQRIADPTRPLGPILFTVGDDLTPAGAVRVTATSSDPAVVPDGGLVVAGDGADRTLTVTPTGRAGTAVITLVATDASGLTGRRAFTLTVDPPPPVNTPPGLDPLVDLVLLVGAAGGTILRLTDAETPAGQLVVSVTTSDPAVVPAAGLVVAGGGAARTLSVIPTGAAGAADVTVTVADAGGLTVSRRFRVTVTAPVSPPPPPVSPPPPPAAKPAPGFAVGGAGGVVQAVRPTGTTLVAAPGMAGAVRTATADFTGDGVADTVAGSGPGTASRVVVLDGASGAILADIPAFEASFLGGVFVAAADLDGDGKAEIVVTPDRGGGPVVAVYRADGTPLARFFGIEDAGFRGGARAAAADLNGDGRAELLVAAGFGGGPRLAIYDGKTVLASNGQVPARLVGDFFVFEPTLRNGVFVAAGDLTGDGAADVVVGGGPGGGPRVFALDGRALVGGTQTVVVDFFAGDPNNRGGVRVAVRPDAAGQPQLVTGSGDNEAARVRVYPAAVARAGGPPTQELTPFDGATLADGVYVG